MTELIEMIQMLLDMGTDTYTQCKYALLSVSWEHQETNAFYQQLFSLTDNRRPLCIGMKGEISR